MKNERVFINMGRFYEAKMTHLPENIQIYLLNKQK